MAAALWVQAATPIPELGNARIVVLANNLQNYYYNYTESSRPSYSDEAGFQQKILRDGQLIIIRNGEWYDISGRKMSH